MKRPNPLSPDLMTAAERRTDLCGLLALGLVRLRMRETGEARYHLTPCISDCQKIYYLT